MRNHFVNTPDDVLLTMLENLCFQYVHNPTSQRCDLIEDVKAELLRRLEGIRDAEIT